ncbi:HIT family protein [Geodermatophilus chilensis]|uniref:hypothetical protein n=1 Tax=Geodermatophilus chilensis TaxID=2035835 RepID=UPI000C2628B8|nr:hypothetical protein [Geodermatophilus chilensis]
MLPTVGRVVHYRAKTRGYVLPAIVTVSADSLDPTGVELGHIPPLSSDTHVHLHVMTAGAQVQYQEFDVPQGDGPGTWNWPPRVGG